MTQQKKSGTPKGIRLFFLFIRSPDVRERSERLREWDRKLLQPTENRLYSTWLFHKPSFHRYNTSLRKGKYRFHHQNRRF